MTLANQVTLLRLGLIPVFGWLTWSWIREPANPTWRWSAFGLFVLVAATDAIDGHLARRRDEITVLGSWLDPIADKLLIFSGLLILSPSRIPAWYLLVWFLREVVMLGGATLMNTRIPEIRMSPRPVSKAATFLQLLVLGGAFLDLPGPLYQVLLVMAAGFTVASGAVYVRDGFQQVRD